MSAGFVYVATNPSFTGMVKIGRTSKRPDKRIAGLSNTSVPFGFELESFMYSDDVSVFENRCHKALDDLRVTRSKEFFYMSPEDAYAAIEATFIDIHGSADVDFESFSDWRIRDIDEDLANGIERGVW